MDIASLRAFIAVSRDGSFSKASERLFITQPAVSKRVASLEAELGVELFNRIARSVSLTEAGEQLLGKAREIVAQADELQRYATNLDDEISGSLSVSIAHHIGLYRMQPILRTFKERYPKVSLDIRFEDSEQAFHSVEQGDIEFGVITLPQTLPTNIKREAIWVDQLHIVVANDHPLATANSVGLDDLANHPCVLTSKETETHMILQRLFQARGLAMQVQMQTNSLETLKMLAGAGIGWTLLPSTMLQKPDAGKVQTEFELKTIELGRNLQRNHLKRNLGLVMHSKRSLSNAATALRDLIRASV